MASSLTFIDNETVVPGLLLSVLPLFLPVVFGVVVAVVIGGLITFPAVLVP